MSIVNGSPNPSASPEVGSVSSTVVDHTGSVAGQLTNASVDPAVSSAGRMSISASGAALTALASRPEDQALCTTPSSPPTPGSPAAASVPPTIAAAVAPGSPLSSVIAPSSLVLTAIPAGAAPATTISTGGSVAASTTTPSSISLTAVGSGASSTGIPGDISSVSYYEDLISKASLTGTHHNQISQALDKIKEGVGSQGSIDWSSVKITAEPDPPPIKFMLPNGSVRYKMKCKYKASFNVTPTGGDVKQISFDLMKKEIYTISSNPNEVAAIVKAYAQTASDIALSTNANTSPHNQLDGLPTGADKDQVMKNDIFSIDFKRGANGNITGVTSVSPFVSDPNARSAPPKLSFRGSSPSQGFYTIRERDTSGREVVRSLSKEDIPKDENGIPKSFGNIVQHESEWDQLAYISGARLANDGNLLKDLISGGQTKVGQYIAQEKEEISKMQAKIEELKSKFEVKGWFGKVKETEEFATIKQGDVDNSGKVSPKFTRYVKAGKDYRKLRDESILKNIGLKLNELQQKALENPEQQEAITREMELVEGQRGRIFQLKTSIKDTDDDISHCEWRIKQLEKLLHNLPMSATQIHKIPFDELKKLDPVDQEKIMHAAENSESGTSPKTLEFLAEQLGHIKGEIEGLKQERAENIKKLEKEHVKLAETFISETSSSPELQTAKKEYMMAKKEFQVHQQKLTKDFANLTSLQQQLIDKKASLEKLLEELNRHNEAPEATSPIDPSGVSQAIEIVTANIRMNEEVLSRYRRVIEAEIHRIVSSSYGGTLAGTSLGAITATTGSTEHV